MECFQIFKGKIKCKKSVSAPERNTPNKSSNSSAVSKRGTRSSSSLPSPRSVVELYKEKEHNLRVFQFSELKEATSGFNRMLKIGEGGFGSVYKGSIMPQNGQGTPLIVAIKKLNKGSLQGHKQWVAEIQFLGIVDNPNLVKLLGYCSIDGERGIQRLLVYEFMPNKSLEDHLFSKALPPMPWKTRLDVILGAAEGLNYLHEGLEVQVIYRDFKSSNVLLDKNFQAKLSDFGLAREGPTGNRTHVTTGVVGTYGYAAPEYIETGHLTLKSDIWSFGVVLYELLTGRRTLEKNRPTVEQKLLEWVKLFPPDSKRFPMMIDPRLRNQFSINAARKIAKLADSCLNKNAKERPTMREVAERLKEAINESNEFEAGSSVEDKKGESSGFKIYGMDTPVTHTFKRSTLK